MAAPYFIATTDFGVRPYRIPNLEESTDFEDYMIAKEEEICRQLFGFETWDLIKDALDTSGALDPEIEGLRDGADYTYLETNYHFYGMKDLLIPCIYSEWLKDTFYKGTNIALGINKKTDFNNISPAFVIVSTWNIFIDKAGHADNYFNSLWGYMKSEETYFDLWDEDALNYWRPGRKNDWDI
ncbi:MAG: hypothetical protein RI909_1882 [Bacteroidota bacterium]